MKSKSVFGKALTAALILYFHTLNANAFDIGLTPALVDEVIKPGSERTIAYSLTNASSKAPIRMQVLVYDWLVDAQGNIITPKPGTYQYSASNWVEVSPSEFVVKPHETQIVRGTFKVPADAPPGDYLTALFFRQRVIAPPLSAGSMGQIIPQGLIASIAYISVPPLERKPSLEAMRFAVGGDKKNPTVIVGIKNEGNSHIRPRGYLQIFDAGQNSVFLKDFNDLSVVLRDSVGIREFPIETNLVPGKYEAVVNLRLDPKVTDITRGRLNFEISEKTKVLGTIKEQKQVISKTKEEKK